MKKVLERIKNDNLICKINEHAAQYADGISIYLVGGAVRDFYLDQENFDKDIIVSGISAKDFSINLAQALDATFVPLDEEFNIYRLVLKDKLNFIDVARLIGASIEDDLMRRDLTINSIAVNLKTLEILDVNGGVKDLKEKKIKLISEQNFVDDPLRLLRAFRFESTLGFALDENLLRVINKHAKEIHKSAVERVNYELLKLFAGKNVEISLKDMDKSGLLDEILPITLELKKVPKNSHHHLNLFYHSIETVKQIQELYMSSSESVKEHLESVDFGGFSRIAQLKFAGFLHDIGKPDTWTIEEDTGRHRFIKHDDVGSKLAAKILKSSKFSKKQIEYICKMIKYHIYPSHVVSAPEINEKIYMRFIRKMQDDVIDVIILAMADRLSARGVEITDEIVAKNINALKALLDFYLSVKDTLAPLPKLLSGDEIMKMLDISPSKELGNIINALKEAQLSGEIATKQDAEAFVKSFSMKFNVI